MTNYPPTNLDILKKSRKKIHPGDIFALKLRGVGYLWGRVVYTDAMSPLCHERCTILIYLHTSVTLTKTKPSVLHKEDLIVPPQLINRLPWSRGYFETVENRPIEEGDVYPHHCFRCYARDVPRFYDEFGNQVAVPFDPCGTYALSSYRVVDDELSEKMGIPLAPD